MTVFQHKLTSTATITATREQVWAALTDPDLVARITPQVRSIAADGEHWTWQMSGFEAVGVKLAPCFRVRMSYVEPERISWVGDPAPGSRERVSTDGLYTLGDAADGNTDLYIELTVKADLPLPGLSRPAVTTTMSRTMAVMGDRFSKNLLDHLGAKTVA